MYIKTINKRGSEDIPSRGAATAGDNSIAKNLKSQKPKSEPNLTQFSFVGACIAINWLQLVSGCVASSISQAEIMPTLVN